MATINLGAGIFPGYVIDEATTINGGGWDTIIVENPETTSPEVHNGIYAYADVTLNNLTLCWCRQQGLRSDHLVSPLPTITLNNVWVHNNGRNGILSQGDTVMDQCLVERNGVNRQFDHGLYSKGDHNITNCIFRHNAGYSLCMSNAGQQVTVTGTVTGCLIYGGNALVLYPDLGATAAVTYCTVEGGLYSADNIEDGVDNNAVDDAVARFVSPSAGLYWPQGEMADGCYAYDAGKTLAAAKLLWPHPITDPVTATGAMYNHPDASSFTPDWPDR